MDPLGSKVLLNSSVGDDLSSEAVLDIPSGSTTVFCPVNINNRHWILLVLRRLIKVIEVYDPRGNEHPNIIHTYMNFWAIQRGRNPTLSPRGSIESPVSHSQTVETVVCLFASMLAIS